MINLDSWLTKAFHEWKGETFSPFQWQRRAFHDLINGKLPTAVEIPTGSGKTIILVLWTLALAAQKLRNMPITLPKRLIWVVHRRTVVDQTTDVAQEIQRLIEKSAAGSPWTDVRTVLSNEYAYPLSGVPPLLVSTIRGALAEDPTWRVDPVRPAIIIGTVDKLGSRLLFQGYGDGRWARSFHAGLLATDTWWVLDEAHLVPAFSENLRKVEGERHKELLLESTESLAFKPLQVTHVSATLSAGSKGHIWRVLPDDNDPLIAERTNANKTVYRVKEWGSRAPSAEQLSQFVHTLAAGSDESRKKLRMEPDSGRRVVVFVQSPELAAAVATNLIDLGYEPGVTLGLLTGQLRGYERDRLAESLIFGYFKQAKDSDDGKPHILVCTSAGEVGVDFNADHALIESCYLDALIQRLGRVNRYGKTKSTVWLFEAPQRPIDKRAESVESSGQVNEEDETEEMETEGAEGNGNGAEGPEAQVDRIERGIPSVSNLLSALGKPKKGVGAIASPSGLIGIWAKRDTKLLPTPPTFAQIDDDVLSLFSATSFDEQPASIPLDLYLHGERRDPPDVSVIWRAELDLLSHNDIEPIALGQAIDRMGVLQGEMLRLPLNKFLKWLGSKTNEGANFTILVRQRGVWISGTPRKMFRAMEEQRTNDVLVVLPLAIGGLGRFGEFSPGSDERVADVFDLAAPGVYRAVEVDEELLGLDKETGEWSAAGVGSLDRSGKLGLGESGESFLRFRFDWRRMAGRGYFSLIAEERLSLVDHHRRTMRAAELILSKIALPKREASSIKHGTGHHDDGKHHPLWQRAVGGSEQEPLAKAPRINGRALRGYRHELGSLLTIAITDDDLALHFVAVHHGWGRPHFLPKHYDVMRYTEQQNLEAAAMQLERFRKLEEQYGRWTLAYLEALIKTADIYGSLRESHD